MFRNTNWIGIGVFSAALIGTIVVGCDNQTSNPDNIPGVPKTAVNTTTAAPQTNTTPGAGASATASPGSFDDAANIWSRVEEARAELDTAIKARKLDQVHEATSKIRDLVKTLPDKSTSLPEDKRKTLDAHVKNVGELAAMMDKSDDPNDLKSVQEHHTAMNDALDMMKRIYPAEAMRSSMHMPAMNSSSKGIGDSNDPGKGMDDDKMPGKDMPGMDDKMPPMGGKSGMDMGMMDKMGGMGKPMNPGKMSGMPDDSMPSKGMGDPKMGGMGMDDKMMSGMSATDKSEMKMMMDKMAAMPPAERKKAMQKATGMSKATDTGKQADPKDKPMPGGGMSDM